MTSYKIRNAACYIGLGVALWAQLPDEPTVNNWVLYACTWLLFVVVDVDSYANGMQRGSDIAREAMDSLIASVRGQA